LADKPPHKITGLWFGAGAPLARSLEDVAEALGRLPGKVSFAAFVHSDKGTKPLARLNEDEPLAIGSAFKLYVMAELVRTLNAGERKWEDVVRLESQAVSLPSGILQNCPPDAPLTLHSLASLMIAMSDNTATDQLIRLLGRERIEAVQEAAGHREPALNAPFLTTLEFFKLKMGGDAGLRDRFIAAEPDARRAILSSEIAAMPRPPVVAGDTPVAIESIEWFASASDLARVLIWLRDQTAPDLAAHEGRAVLAINPGLSQPAGPWVYRGFKGGAEEGVCNLSLLLKHKDGHWFTVVGTWNDGSRAIDAGAFTGLIERAIECLNR
jgi:hypothetical protein